MSLAMNALPSISSGGHFLEALLLSIAPFVTQLGTAKSVINRNWKTALLTLIKHHARITNIKITKHHN